MSAGRLLLLPSLLGASEVDEVLPVRVQEAARTTRHFLAERAKSARAFLKVLGHPIAMQELHIVEIGHTPEAARIDEWLHPLHQGHDVALVAEAGCPGVADPGATIVARAHALGIEVRPLVGPCSPLLALMGSGLDGQRFRFVGYLPQDQEQCAIAITQLEAASRAGETQLFIETPYRNQRLFEALLRRCSDDTLLTVAIALTSPQQLLATRTIAAWRSLAAEQRPALRNLPAVFALLAPGRRAPKSR